MISIDKAAMFWTIAIVAVAIGYAAAGQYFTTEISQTQSEPTSVISSEKSGFKTFKNSEYGFSIDFPQNMKINDEVFPWLPEPGYDDGGASIVWFSKHPLDLHTDIFVSFSKNNNNARIYEGQDYLNILKAFQEEFCDETITFYTRCDSSLIDSKIFTIDGRKAYQITYEYDYVEESGLGEHKIVVLTDIVDGNNLWFIASSSTPTKYLEIAPIIEKTINSFSIT